MPKVNGARLKHRIAELDLSTEDLSSATGIPCGTLRNVLAGTRPMRLARIYKIGRLLALPVSEVLAESEEVPDEPPTQPSGPRKPVKRKDTEEKRTGPKRANNSASAA